MTRRDCKMQVNSVSVKKFLGSCFSGLPAPTVSLFLAGILFASSGCGYHLSGKAAVIPGNVDSIAIPVFVNKTIKYSIEQRLTAAVVDEFVARTHYRITSDPESAQALLSGQVMEYRSTPVIFANGVATTYAITVRMKVSMKDLKTDKLLFENNNYAFREEFEISSQPAPFFPEEGPAMDRLAATFAKSLVSTILDSF
jgi:outer membrane lipopolysaccharide assembly protein LptE/RlpB